MAVNAGDWIKVPGGSAGEGILVWTGEGPAPLLSPAEQRQLRNMLGWSSAPATGADKAFQEENQAGFEGSLASAGSALGLANSAFLRLMGLSDEQAKLGKQLGGEISSLSRTFLGESTPLRRGLIGAAEQRLGVPLLADLPEGHKRGLLTYPKGKKKGQPTPLTAAAAEQLKIRNEAATGALFGPSAPERAAIENQFTNARQSLLESSPARGGLLASRLAQLPEDRARAIGEMEAAATDKALALGADVGFGTRGLALGGLATGAGIQQRGLEGAAASMGGAGAGFTGVGNAFTNIGNSFGGMFNAAEDRSQQLALFQLGLQEQQKMAAQQAQASKKGGTGAGIGSGVGSLIPLLALLA